MNMLVYPSRFLSPSYPIARVSMSNHRRWLWPSPPTNTTVCMSRRCHWARRSPRQSTTETFLPTTTSSCVRACLRTSMVGTSPKHERFGHSGPTAAAPICWLTARKGCNICRKSRIPASQASSGRRKKVFALGSRCAVPDSTSWTLWCDTFPFFLCTPLTI